MRIGKTALDVLCCPVGRGALRQMAGPEVQRLNEAVAQGRARCAGGQAVKEALAGGLATTDEASFYRIQDGVPVLLPALRITLDGPAPRPRGGERPQAESPWERYWEAIATRWDDLRPPRRPAPEDVALFQDAVGEALRTSRRAESVALLLGVTPEIATMGWPTGARLFALDSSPAMIRNVWPATEVPEATVVRGDWRTMPFRDAVCDIVLGDASIAGQPYPEPFLKVKGEVRRVLREGGVLATRAFTRPERKEPLEAIFADLRDGRIGTLDFLRWRLAAALHGDRATGTRMADIWDAWETGAPDADELMKSLGWPPGSARVMANLRGGQAVLHFPTLSELRESLSPDFEEIACEFPGYEDGDRYPTLVFRVKPRSSARLRT